jgi:hypothetical protein
LVDRFHSSLPSSNPAFAMVSERVRAVYGCRPNISISG